IPAIAERRLELIEVANGRPDDVRAAAEAVVRPVTEFAQRGWRERAYVQIGSELANRPERATPEIQSLLARTEGYEAWELLRARCPTVPDDLWSERSNLCIVFIGRAAADRARALDNGGAHPVLSDDQFVDILIDMVIGALTAASSKS